MSEEKWLYKLYIDDHYSETFEEFLANRVIRLQADVERYKVGLEAIVDASKILDYTESSNSVQLKAFAEFAREKANKALKGGE